MTFCLKYFSRAVTPDIEDVQAIAKPVLGHRIVRNFKAEGEGISADEGIGKLV